MPWIQPNGMLAYWRAEGDTSDSAGNYDGTAVGSVTYSDGQVSQAFNLPGSASVYVNTGFGPGIVIGDGSAFTIEAWLKDSNPSGGYHSVIGCYSGSAGRFYIQINNSNPVIGIGNSGKTMGNLTVAQNQWHYIAATYDGSSTIKTYFDMTSQSVAHTSSDYYDGPLYIGTLNEGGTSQNPFNGQIDEVAIYDRVLSDEEAANHYNNGLRGYPFGYALINGFDQSSVGTDELVTSSIDRSGLVSAIQNSESDTYFDSTDELSSVLVYYQHQEKRQKKRIVHDGSNLIGTVAWSRFARDGTWEKNKVICIGHEGARALLNRTDIGTLEDVTLSDGTVSLKQDF